MQTTSEKSRIARGKRVWRSSGSEASSETAPAPLVSSTPAPLTSLAPPPVTSPLLQKCERRREHGLRRLWTAVRSVSGTGGGDELPSVDHQDEDKPGPTCSLPLLQVWPSQDSPRGEADGQSFVFPIGSPRSSCSPRTPLSPTNRVFHNDSGIDSVQASPSPAACSTSSMSWRCGAGSNASAGSGAGGGAGGGAGLLHPEHARLLLRQGGLEEPPEPPPPGRLSASSSTTSSLTSVNHSVGACASARTSDPWLRDDHRRSSTMTMTRFDVSSHRYSLFDALDLEYALLRAAARGSVGPYSLSESLHKLTFTQSLAFPALARGLAGKRSRSAQAQERPCASGSARGEPGVNACAKVVTTLVLVLVSMLVFGVVYKFVRA